MVFPHAECRYVNNLHADTPYSQHMLPEKQQPNKHDICLAWTAGLLAVNLQLFLLILITGGAKGHPCMTPSSSPMDMQPLLRPLLIHACTCGSDSIAHHQTAHLPPQPGMSAKTLSSSCSRYVCLRWWWLQLSSAQVQQLHQH